jgi:Holliday junction DNA helicase RuvA
MIVRLSGKVIDKGPNYVHLAVGAVVYKVLLPQTVSERVEADCATDNNISLVIYHYLQVEPARSTPYLIGFLNEIEKEFFEVFITVSGIGPRAALKALNKPISSIARAIDEADVNFLRSLPGIGEQRAKEIIAKLQTKVGKFGLIQDERAIGAAKKKTQDIEEEAITILEQLQYKKSEARQMVQCALQRQQDITTTEELLNEVYRQRKCR